jgi:hypothetical protein
MEVPSLNSASLLDSAIKSGAPLVAVHRIPLFREFSRSSLHRLIRTGKVPAIRVGRSYYSTPEIAAAALTEGSAIPAMPQAAHDQAMANLARKGIRLDNPEKAMGRLAPIEKRRSTNGVGR